MKNYLNRFICMFILLALVVNGHAPKANYLFDGFWPASEQVEYVLPWEEEVETESETHFDILNSDGSDDGGGGDDEIGLPTYFDDESSSSEVFFLSSLAFPLHNSQHISFSKVQIEASSQELLMVPKPLLFLLYHNIKSDITGFSA